MFKFLFAFGATGVVLLLTSCNDSDQLPGKIVDLSGKTITNAFPLDESIDVGNPVTFSWDTLGSGVAYDLTIATDEDMEEIAVEVSDIQDSSFTTQLQHGVWYYWKLSATNSLGDRISSSTKRFRTMFAKPEPSPTISTYYVSPSGQDVSTSGSLDKPFKTLFYASKMVPEGEGDVIQLSSGTFIETEEVSIPIGVSVQGEGTENTVIVASSLETYSEENFDMEVFKNNPRGSLIQLISPFRNDIGDVLFPEEGNQAISDLTIDGSDKQLKAAIWVQNRNNVSLKNLQIRDCAQRGIVVSRGTTSNKDSEFIQGLEVASVSFRNSGVDFQGESLGNLSLGGLDGARIHDIDIEDDEGYGIKFMFRGYFRNCEFYNIKTQLNEFDPLWTEDAALELWNLGPGNKVYNIESNTWHSYINDPAVYTSDSGVPNLEITNIRIIDQDGANTDRGIEMAVPNSTISESYIQDKGFGIAIWETARQNLTIRNNIFFNTSFKSNFSGGAAIYIDNSKSWDFDDIRIYNNVFDTHNYGVRVRGERVVDVFVRNNLFLNTGIRDVENGVFQARVSVLNNFKATDDGSEGWVFEGISDSNNGLGDPLLQRSGQRWDSYYFPLEMSPLIDAGLDVGLSFLGDAPDIGRYEVQ